MAATRDRRGASEVAEGRTPDYEALVASVNGIVWEGDAQTLRFHFVSPQAERLLGYPAKRWIEEPGFWLEHIHPDDRDRVLATCRSQTAEGHDHELEYRMIAANGQVVWLRDIVSVITEDGRPAVCRGVMLDIGEHKADQEALRLATDRLRAVIANAPVVLVTLDREGVFTFCEGGPLERAGLSPSDFLGRSVDDAFAGRPEAEPIRANLRRALAGEEFTAQERLGDVVSETHIMPVRDADGNPDGVVGVVLDVSDRVRADEERKALEAQVLHTQKLESLGVLAGGIAHDFNNLLMTILGSAELVISDLPEDSDLHRGVDRIRRAARTAASLTNQLLAYGGRVPFEVRPLDLSALVVEMTDLLHVSISKKAELRLNLADDLPPIEADSAQLDQVVLNLVINASEALEDEVGSITVRTGTLELGPEDLSRAYLREGLVEEGRYVFLEVSDTGAGMDEDTRSRMFDPFFSTKFAGRGLGMAGVLGIVRAHRGAVSVYSEPGQGTLLRVLFPSTQAVAATTRPGPENAPWRGEGVLLVVDDEPDVRELACVMAKRLGFRVLSARDGSEAVRVFTDHADEIRGVLLDMTMPEMDGRETARALNRLSPELPIVLMSGYTEEYAATRLASPAVSGFVQKPFEQHELARVLQRALADGG